MEMYQLSVFLNIILTMTKRVKACKLVLLWYQGMRKKKGVVYSEIGREQ